MKIYKCSICGKIVEVINDSSSPLVCCGEHMKELVPGTSDGAVEKHVPVVEVNGNVITVKIGEVEHPMVDAHYIEWIAIKTKEGCQRKYFSPGNSPKAEFYLSQTDEFEIALAYCNLHGLWSS